MRSLDAIRWFSIKSTMLGAVALAVLLFMRPVLPAADLTKIVDKTDKSKADNLYSEVGDFATGDEKAAGGVANKATAKPKPQIDPRDLERNQIERRFAVGDLLDPTPIFDWENHHVLHLNREPSHCTQMVYPSTESALAAAQSAAKVPMRELSPCYQLLNGMWKFNWVQRPADRPEDFFKTDFDDSAWATAVAAQP